MRYLADCIVTMLYIGRIPLAPGSWASLAAVILWLNIFNNLNYLLLPIISLILFFIGTYFSHLALKTTNKKDPSFIVVYEWVCQWITFSFLPVNYTIAILGFLLFIKSNIFVWKQTSCKDKIYRCYKKIIGKKIL